MRAGGDEDDAALDPGRRRRAHELVRELVHEEKVREMIDREVSLDAVLGEVEERLRDDPRGAQDAVQRHRERAERGRERADGSHAREVARLDDDLRGGALDGRHGRVRALRVSRGEDDGRAAGDQDAARLRADRAGAAGDDVHAPGEV
eukprot:29496-Pelagococcus_subviridis.AAC.6